MTCDAVGGCCRIDLAFCFLVSEHGTCKRVAACFLEHCCILSGPREKEVNTFPVFDILPFPRAVPNAKTGCRYHHQHHQDRHRRRQPAVLQRGPHKHKVGGGEKNANNFSTSSNHQNILDQPVFLALLICILRTFQNQNPNNVLRLYPPARAGLLETKNPTHLTVPLLEGRRREPRTPLPGGGGGGEDLPCSLDAEAEAENAGTGRFPFAFAPGVLETTTDGFDAAAGFPWARGAVYIKVGANGGRFGRGRAAGGGYGGCVEIHAAFGYRAL